MSDVIVTTFEGDVLPDHVMVNRILATEEIPWGIGTATRRRYTLLCTDTRYWLSDEEKIASPIRPREARP